MDSQDNGPIEVTAWVSKDTVRNTPSLSGEYALQNNAKLLHDFFNASDKNYVLASSEVFAFYERSGLASLLFQEFDAHRLVRKTRWESRGHLESYLNDPVMLSVAAEWKKMGYDFGYSIVMA